MTDENTTTPTATEIFWAQRDADKKLIADMLREVADRIGTFAQNDFYRDGLPADLQNVHQTAQVFAQQLHPVAAMPNPNLAPPLPAP